MVSPRRQRAAARRLYICDVFMFKSTPPQEGRAMTSRLALIAIAVALVSQPRGTHAQS